MREELGASDRFLRGDGRWENIEWSDVINKPDWLDLRGVNFYGDAQTPNNPPVGKARIYIKGGKLIVQYNDAGTIRYKYLDLSGTGVTWVHSLTAP